MFALTIVGSMLVAVAVLAGVRYYGSSKKDDVPVHLGLGGAVKHNGKQ